MSNFSNLFKSSFSKIGLFAIPLTVCIVAMGVFFPKESPEHYSSFIVAFEFVKTPEQVTELFQLLAPTDEAIDQLSIEEKITGLNIGNYVDFIFMVVYSLFVFLFFKKAAPHYDLKWLKLGMPLAILALLCDIGENIHLIKIASAYPSEAEMSGFLTALPFFVWTKWMALAFACGLGSIAFLLGKKLITKLLAFVLIIPILLGIMALITQSDLVIDGFTAGVSVSLAIMVMSCFWLE
ncbi:MAG: hypothetical protein ACI9XO_000069 [Paraglaciecola sp.]|jgi:hypothetical protein